MGESGIAIHGQVFVSHGIMLFRETAFLGFNEHLLVNRIIPESEKQI